MKVIKDEGFMNSDSKTMNPIEVLSMISEADLKAKQFFTIIRRLKDSTGGIEIFKEDSIRKLV